MYAVIKTGGKQYRVTEGQRLEVERLSAGDDGAVTFVPVLIVDDSDVIAAPGELASALVSGRVVGEAKGPKITGFRYKNKSNQRKRWGHRQMHDVVEITGISRG